MKRLLPILIATWCSSLCAETIPKEEWTYLDNGTIRIGVNRSAGATLGWFSLSQIDFNYLNRFDLGRYLQQSWYGDEDGSDWNGKPWRWNPVQGGNWQHVPAEVTSFETGEFRLTSNSIPVHWATGEAIEDVRFKQTIELHGPVVAIEFEMSYHGKKSHKARHQELPAIFLDHTLKYLHCLEAGESEMTSFVPGWPNERVSLTRDWFASLNDDGHGIGIWAPGAEELTCYRAEGGPAPQRKGACSYLAPIKTMAIEPGFTYRYQVFLTIGTTPHFKNRFHEIVAPIAQVPFRP